MRTATIAKCKEAKARIKEGSTIQAALKAARLSPTTWSKYTAKSQVKSKSESKRRASAPGLTTTSFLSRVLDSNLPKTDKLSILSGMIA